MTRLLQFANKAILQVVDYSPVTAIFRLISSFFTPFLSHKHLVSRRLREKQGLIESLAQRKRGKCFSRRAQRGRRQAETSTSSVESLGRVHPAQMRIGGGIRMVTTAKDG
jgi:hypothetical protein